jgi:alkanesulfonate monooxygenase SsuD/methylene tetrahydromethanopterin reductase-like flavin-dependent oxidoreductase (luciferase family)
MRFSVVGGPRQRADLGETAYQAQRNFVEDAILGEELGYDAAYFGEHHFCFASGNSSPLTLLAELGARTKRIRIGTSVICAPFHNPLRLAEDIASVDMISNGRFDLGIGVGSQWEEFQTFGIDPKERFGRTWEIIDIIERCLSSKVGEVFDWKGKYYDFPGINWIMQPIQEKIPIFWGGFGPQGVKRAAERGYNLIAPDVTGTYQRVMREHGRDPAKAHIGFATLVSIGDTFDDAIAPMAEPCTWVSNEYALRTDLEGITPPESHRQTIDEVISRARAGGISDFAFPKPGEKPAPFSVPLAGTVSHVRDYFLSVVRGERGLVTHFCLGFREPGTPTEAVHKSMRLFASEILPALREEAAKKR